MKKLLANWNLKLDVDILSFVMYRLGVELHAKHRLGALVFIENSPQFNDSDAIATSHVIGIPYHAFGMGVMIKW